MGLLLTCSDPLLLLASLSYRRLAKSAASEDRENRPTPAWGASYVHAPLRHWREYRAILCPLQETRSYPPVDRKFLASRWALVHAVCVRCSSGGRLAAGRDPRFRLVSRSASIAVARGQSCRVSAGGEALMGRFGFGHRHDSCDRKPSAHHAQGRAAQGDCVHIRSVRWSWKVAQCAARSASGSPRPSPLAPISGYQRRRTQQDVDEDGSS